MTAVWPNNVREFKDMRVKAGIENSVIVGKAMSRKLLTETYGEQLVFWCSRGREVECLHRATAAAPPLIGNSYASCILHVDLRFTACNE